MKLFARKIFTFIEEQSTVSMIVLSKKEEHLICDCKYCAATNPLDPDYKPREMQEMLHYFTSLTYLFAEFASLTKSDRKNYMINYLEDCELNGTDLRTSISSIGGETVPSYEALISLVKN